MDLSQLRSELTRNSWENILTRKNWEMSHLTEGDQISYIFTNLQFPLFNILFKPQFNDKEQMFSRLQSLIHYSQKHSLPLMFWPAAEAPSPFYEEVLNSLGFMETSKPEGMVLKRDNLQKFKGSYNLDIIEVKNQENLEKWVEITSHLYGLKGINRRGWKEMVESAGFGRKKGWNHFIGKKDGETVAASSIFEGKNSFALANVSVPVEFRNFGFGYQISRYPIEIFFNKLDLCTLWATVKGRRVYEKLGFKTVFQSSIQIYNPL